MSYRRLWIAFGLIVGLSFAVLLYYGVEIYRQAPPVPEQVVTDGGALVTTGAQIRDGQNVWQSTGGQELGTVWGHRRRRCAVGALALGWFVAGLKTGWSLKRETDVSEQSWPRVRESRAPALD